MVPKRFSLLILNILVAVLLAGGMIVPARAESFSSPPPGFHLVNSTYGVALYQKDYPNGTPDYVQVVDLSEGASIELMHGEIEGAGEGRGVFGGVNPKMAYRTLQSYWNSFSAENPEAFCVTNGQFFYMPETPTKLSLPLKKDGTMVTEGYAANEFSGQTLMLEIWPDRADIRPLSKEALYSSDAPNIIGGLTEEAPKRVKRFVPRTFVGVDDRDGNGQFETLLIFNTRSARQADAADVLQSFGSDKVMMLDGGGSTQLICQGDPVIYSERWIPQAIGVSGAVLPPYQVRRASAPGWSVLIEGESASTEIELVNSGSESWEPDQTNLIYWISALDGSMGPSGEQIIPLAGSIANKGVLPVKLPLEGTNRGAFSIQWQLIHGDERFPAEPLNENFLVLPEALAEKRVDLETQLRQWQADNNPNIPVLIENWVNRQRIEVEPQTVIRGDPEPRLFLIPDTPLALDLTGLFVVSLIVILMGTMIFLTVSRRLRYREAQEPIHRVEY